jgi:hypothetical protein
MESFSQACSEIQLILFVGLLFSIFHYETCLIIL